jgi:excinuclease UvrABC nuclease subunit
VVSEEKIFLNRPIRKTNCLWRPCLLADREEMCNRYRGSSIDAFYQDLIHLAKRFQRRRFKKMTNQNQELPLAVMFINGSEQNEKCS